MNKEKRAFHQILDKEFAVRSGVYSIIEPSIKMQMNENGEYWPVITKNLSRNTYRKLLNVDLMSDYSPNEDEIAKSNFGGVKGIEYDPEIGYYTGLYAGHVATGAFRQKASSGGMTSWIMSQLLEKDIVDYVIHMKPVDPKDNGGILFKYEISKSKREILSGAKSKYYPGELSQVLKQVKQKAGRYAVIGIPEFITELRLLAREDAQIEERLKVMLGLVCGHQKTAKYAEALAWQNGIEPGNLSKIDFRIKQPESTAINYLHEFSGVVNDKSTTVQKTHQQLFGEVWAYGFFKSKFSDFSDNVFNENADVVLGDAWLPQYNADGLGNNIVIVRNPTIQAIIDSGINDGSLNLDKVPAETIKRSQCGLIHHGRDELPYRLKKQKGWRPRKRYEDGSPSLARRHIQDLRYKMARRSRKEYSIAVKKNKWQHFEQTMSPMIQRYTYLYTLNNGEFVNKRDNDLSTNIDYVITRIRHKVRLRGRLRKLKQKTRIRTRLREYMWRREIRADKIARQRMASNPNGAILTLTGYHNYGNILQRYALQKVFANHGYYFTSYAQEPLNTQAKEYDKFRNLVTFVQERIPRKKPETSDDFSYYVTGSDQIWRRWGSPDEGVQVLLNRVKYYFFADVQRGNAKKIAYAASFGHDNIEQSGLDDEFMESVKPLVKSMDAISVREESGIAIVKKYWNKEAALVLDPTLLLSKREYDKLIYDTTCPIATSKKGFAYILAHTDTQEKRVKAIFAHHKVSATELYHYHKDNKKLMPVEQWLKNIREATVVVADSFHGIVFSIIFHTPFVVLENEKGGIARIETLLKNVGLEDRLIRNNEAVQEKIATMTPIDWGAVDKKLDTLKDDSEQWLLRSLEDN